MGEGVGAAILSMGSSMERAGRDLAAALAFGLTMLSLAWVATACLAR